MTKGETLNKNIEKHGSIPNFVIQPLQTGHGWPWNFHCNCAISIFVYHFVQLLGRLEVTIHQNLSIDMLEIPCIFISIEKSSQS